MFQLKKNLIAISIVLMIAVLVGGAVYYRAAKQNTAVAKLRDLKAQVFYTERPEIKESYPFLEKMVVDDYYLSVDTVSVPKGWKGDVEALLAALAELPAVQRVVFAFEDPDLVAEVREKAPNLPIEVAEPDILRASAGGA